MRVLITGGAGFIGSHLADAYLGRGDEVLILDDLSTGSIDNIRHLRSNPRFHYTIESVHHAPSVAELVDRCCALARRLAAAMEAADGVEVLNDVVLNQVLLRFGADDATTDAVIGRVQQDGTCWVGGTRWHGQAAMRVSVSSWSTTEADIDRTAAAILSVARPAS